MPKNPSSRVQHRFAISVISLLAIGIIALAVISIIQRTAGQATRTATRAASVLREDTLLLDDAPTGAVVVVQFLDFESETSALALPAVLKVREVFAGDISFAIRHLPLPAHANAEIASRAVEAAARQGRLEEMYLLLLESQNEWAEREVSDEAVFRGYARDLDLDLSRFDMDMADPEVIDRVRSDLSDARDIGVEAAPAFFIDDEEVDLRSFDDLASEIESAIAAKGTR